MKFHNFITSTDIYSQITDINRHIQMTRQITETIS